MQGIAAQPKRGFKTPQAEQRPDRGRIVPVSCLYRGRKLGAGWMRPIYGSTAGLFQPKMGSFTWAALRGQMNVGRAALRVHLVRKPLV